VRAVAHRQLQDKKSSARAAGRRKCAQAVAEVHSSTGEESEAVTKEEDGSEDAGLVTERKEPVPKCWEVLAENKAVGAALLATKAGGWSRFGLVQVGCGAGHLAITSAARRGRRRGTEAVRTRLLGLQRSAGAPCSKAVS
jgi:hypothetical protein